MPCRRWTLCLLLAGVSMSVPLTAAPAEENYFRVAVAELKLEPEKGSEGKNDWLKQTFPPSSPLVPWVELEGPGEAYLDFDTRTESLDRLRWQFPAISLASAAIVIRVPPGRDVRGRLFAPSVDRKQLESRRFTIPASQGQASFRGAFAIAKAAHYERLLRQNLAGAAWFRHQVDKAETLRGRAATASGPDDPFLGTRSRGDLASSFALMTGGRALSENLSLDRTVRAAAEGSADIDVTSLAGITIQEMDWSKLIAAKSPELDPLASLIPADQHAMFFPNLAALARLLDEIGGQGTPVLSTMDPRSEDPRLLERYQKQLCLPMNALLEQLGKRVIGSIAITGSDPYFPTGTDVAVVFETNDTAAVATFVRTQHAAAQAQRKQVVAAAGNIAGVNYHGVRSDDRSTSSYVAMVGSSVVVTNSLVQLTRLVETKVGKRASLSSLDEYKFFRDRYRRGTEHETAFLVLSDATIRRWCGPQWRIGASRRILASAALAEIQARKLAAEHAGTTFDLAAAKSSFAMDLGELRFDSQSIHSVKHGSLHFQTPIVEMDLARVTKGEADAYANWKRNYETNWRRFFDPIAIQLVATQDQLAAEVTVMPLIWGSDYRWFVDITEGAEMSNDAFALSDKALLRFGMAFNTKSPTIQRSSQTVGGVLRLPNPFGWLGTTLGIYVDDDPVFRELAQADDPLKAVERLSHRLPIVAYAEVSQPLGLATFLGALRTVQEQTAPGIVQWEARKHGDIAYVKVAPTETSRPPNAPRELAFYYAATPRWFLITPSEPALKRALDTLATQRGTASGTVQAAEVWPGKHMGVRAKAGALDALKMIYHSNMQRVLQQRSWGHLPILNEWKRLYPDRDPVAFHESVWGTRLLCPGGGEYRWNSDWKTMESTAYGHPWAPKSGPAYPPAVLGLSGAEFGLTFEHQGLRARTTLQRRPLDKGATKEAAAGQ